MTSRTRHLRKARQTALARAGRPAWLRRPGLRTAAAALAAPALAAALLTGSSAAGAATRGPAAGHPAPDPFSPAYQHPYRKGVVPTIGALTRMLGWAKHHLGTPSALSLTNLAYGGAVDGIGVTTGHPKVYLVFYGTQWGKPGRNSRGDVTLSRDPTGEAWYLQQMFKGLGTGGERWSGVMTQYCQGVSSGAQSCPKSNTHHVRYPTGGALRGVWVDRNRTSPGNASGHQLGVEAVRAAAHFGNTSKSANRNAQYVILSPTGTDPDSWRQQGFCAWHDYNGDSTLTGGAVKSPYGDIAFTNMPYVSNAGSSCGSHFVRSGPGGVRDGVSIVAGHEYAETITDQNPSGGWTDIMGQENGDKCAWISPGGSGGAFRLTVSAETFAMQTTWANDGASGTGACEARHSIVPNG
ncbi:MAG: hypothetical protein LBI49_12030 [Nocardiopsaceae bacterium]|nr:hypothetical protein [Nocardiopsaceae bacterium]